MRDMALKSRSGVMMAVMLPSMLPIPNSRSMEKYSTDHSWGKGMFLIASLYTMKARPGPSTAWNRRQRQLMSGMEADPFDHDLLKKPERTDVNLLHSYDDCFSKEHYSECIGSNCPIAFSE